MPRTHIYVLSLSLASPAGKAILHLAKAFGHLCQLHHAAENMKTAKQQCLKNKSLGARCIFGEPKQ